MKEVREYKDCLTNEMLHKRFKSQFDLVRYAIKLATHKVQLDKDSPFPELENVATEVLDEIAEGLDEDITVFEEPVFLEADIELEEIEVTKPKSRKKAK